MLQGDPGDQFFIIKEGEAVVYQQAAQGVRKVNHLFKADFFGERALLTDEPRAASVEAGTKLRRAAPASLSGAAALTTPFPTQKLRRLLPAVHACLSCPCGGMCVFGTLPVSCQHTCRCLVLARESFVDILGPLYSLMAREKSPAVVTQRLMKLQTKARAAVIPASLHAECAAHADGHAPSCSGGSTRGH